MKRASPGWQQSYSPDNSRELFSFFLMGREPKWRQRVLVNVYKNVKNAAGLQKDGHQSILPASSRVICASMDCPAHGTSHTMSPWTSLFNQWKMAWAYMALSPRCFSHGSCFFSRNSIDFKITNAANSDFSDELYSLGLLSMTIAFAIWKKINKK